MTMFQLSTVPGLAGVAAEELREKLAVKTKSGYRLRNAELLRVDYDGEPKALLSLSVVEDVFAGLGSLRLGGTVADLKALERSLFWGGALNEALGVWSRMSGRPLVKRQVFRVVVQAEDAAWRKYRRADIMLAAERALLAGSSWRLDRDQAPLEIWLQQAGRELLVSLRLSTGAMRQHGGREAERAAALRPSVAAAMVHLTLLADTDVFLDPMCGTGTILLERAVGGRYGLLLGGDNDPEAVRATLTNFGPRHQPRRIERWDATKLPLDDGSVDKIACNLPWGRQISEKAALPALYEEVLREMARVLRTGGRVVLLTSEWDLLKRTVNGIPAFRQVRTISDIEVLGRRADMFVFEKK